MIVNKTMSSSGRVRKHDGPYYLYPRAAPGSEMILAIIL